MRANFYDLLKCAATGIASPSMTYYDRMRASTLMGGAVQTLTGQPPLTFKADGTPLISWSMKGNGSQSGTPSPDNIIMPTFCGVRTGNLWSEDYPNISGTIRYIPIYVGAGSFTLSTTTPYDSGVANLFLLSGNVSTGASTSDNGAWKDHNVTAQSYSGYITIAYRKYSGTTSPAEHKTMLNSGSTALPYEPFGYKLPLTCAGQTVPVYLGQTPTVRRIKKLVLTGREGFGFDNASGTKVTVVSDHLQLAGIVGCVCSHYIAAQNTTGGYYTLPDLHCAMRAINSQFWIRDSSLSPDDFKSYLAAQYAAGTPVTVWYVLETPETGIVNEPLCKIGDYADELISEDAGVSIPTVKGQNTLTVDTPIQPSEMTIKYRE